MKTVTCPYTKISEATAAKNQLAFSDFSVVSTAHAQSNFSQTASVAASTINNQLTLPFYLLIGSFLLFTFLMSFVYVYHWLKFGLNDPFIKNFIPVFFTVILVLIIPLIFNLII